MKAFLSAIKPIKGFLIDFTGVSKYKVSQLFQAVSWFLRLEIKWLASVAMIVIWLLIAVVSTKVIWLSWTRAIH